MKRTIKKRKFLWLEESARTPKSKVSVFYRWTETEVLEVKNSSRDCICRIQQLSGLPEQNTNTISDLFGAKEKKKKLGSSSTQAEFRTCCTKLRCISDSEKGRKNIGKRSGKKGQTVGNHQKPSDPLKKCHQSGNLNSPQKSKRGGKKREATQQLQTPKGPKRSTFEKLRRWKNKIYVR